MSTTCYVIDDERHAIDLMELFINQTSGLELTGKFTSPIAALQALNSGTIPDLLFLDVDMPELSGLDLAGIVATKVQIVFTTSYREYAADAFEINAVDYLLKPVSYDRFSKCVEKITRTVINQMPPTTTGQTSFFVKTGIKGQLQQINIASIRHISAAANYLEIHLENRKVIAYLTLGELLQQLPRENFSQIHKSHIVHLGDILIVEPGQVKLTDGTTLPIGRAFRKTFQAKICEREFISKRD